MDTSQANIEDQILKLLQEVGGLDEDDDLARLPALEENGSSIGDDDDDDDDDFNALHSFQIDSLLPPSPPSIPSPPMQPLALTKRGGPKIPLPGLREVRPVSVVIMKKIPWGVDLKELEAELAAYATRNNSKLSKPIAPVWEMGIALAELDTKINLRTSERITVGGHSLTLEPSKNPCMEQAVASNVLQVKCILLSPEEDYTPLDKSIRDVYKTITSDAERKISAKTAAIIAGSLDKDWEEISIPNNSFRVTRQEGGKLKRKYGIFSVKLKDVDAAIRAKELTDGKIVDILGLKLIIRPDFARVNVFSLKSQVASGDIRQVNNGAFAGVDPSLGLMESYFPFQMIKSVKAPTGSKKKKTEKSAAKKAKKQQQQQQQQQKQAAATAAQKIVPVPIPVPVSTGHQVPVINQSFLQGMTYAFNHPLFAQQFSAAPR